MRLPPAASRGNLNEPIIPVGPDWATPPPLLSCVFTQARVRRSHMGNIRIMLSSRARPPAAGGGKDMAEKVTPPPERYPPPLPAQARRQKPDLSGRVGGPRPGLHVQTVRSEPRLTGS